MILVVTLNPALDVTHHVDGADWAGVNRPHAVTARPGGKGINVARVLHALGSDVLVTGLAGGLTGEALRAGLREAGIPESLTAASGETRRTFAVTDTRRAQTGLFNEPGAVVPAAELAELRGRYTAALPGSAAVVLTGSLPPGVPEGTYAELAALAAAAGVPVILDTDGPALRAGAAARPAILKPNLAELERAAGRPLATGDGREIAESAHKNGGPVECPAGGADGLSGNHGPSGQRGLGGAGELGGVRAAAGELVAAGAGAVVVSLGAGGLLAVTGDGCWRVRVPAVAAPNPTGAGDAVVAGLARGLARQQDWPERLRYAAALGTAAAMAPAAGELDTEQLPGLLARVRVERAAADRA